MSPSDVAELVGVLLGAWGTGWGLGYLVAVFTKASEKI